MTDFDFDEDERRSHLRCAIYEPVKVFKNDNKYDGVVVNMSIGGAAIKLDVILETRIGAGDSVTLFIQGIGRIPATVVRLIPGGFAAELRVGPGEQKHLAAALMRILNNIPLEDLEDL